MSALLGDIAQAEPLDMPGPDRQDSLWSTIGASEIVLAAAAAAGVGALAVPAASNILLTVSGTLIAIEISILLVEAGAVFGVIYFWPEDEVERPQIKIWPIAYM